MVIKVDTFEDIEEGVCNALDIDDEYLREVVRDAYDDAYYNHRDDYGIVFNEWISNFVRENAFNEITEVYVCHLSRLIEKPEVLMPLPDVLTTDTALSQFLKEHSISFRMDGHKLILSYKGREIQPTEIYDPKSVMNKHCGLAFRLGYFYDKQDFCINGFAFGADLKNGSDGYFERLSWGPEILLRLDEFLKTHLRLDYMKHSTYYKAYIKRPIEDIIFDGKDDIKTVEQKSEYFLKKCIEHLAQFYYTGEGMLSIQIIRFADDKAVAVDHYEKIPEETIG
ncbi:MAG: hypothetical protein LIO41_04605 [Ruminococcus sp.]|nr:hypothetical protein [Ruminococcus sp.]